jgi:hypothetical protein
MRLSDDHSECNFLDNRNQKYQLLSTRGWSGPNLMRRNVASDLRFARLDAPRIK